MHKWPNRKKIENRITTVLHTINAYITSAMTPTKDHRHHMIMNTITINNLTIIVVDHHHRIAPTPKCAVRAAQVAIKKKITDKAHGA
jgi:hypothetical protein